jgi:hypothetical protein
MPNDIRPAADREFVAVRTPRAGAFALERAFRSELVLSLLVGCGAEFKDEYWPLLNATRETLVRPPAPRARVHIKQWSGARTARRLVLSPPSFGSRFSMAPSRRGSGSRTRAGRTIRRR